MGYRCRWIAVRGRTREDVLNELGFDVTTEHREEVHDTGLYAVEVGGWVVVMGDGWDHMDIVQREMAQRLSARGAALFFYTDDSAMACELTSFAEGQRVWSWAYDGGSGDGAEPVVEGSPPAQLASALAAAKQAQAEERASGNDEDGYADHVYDVPAAIALALTGFRHDETLSEGAHLPIYELVAR